MFYLSGNIHNLAKTGTYETFLPLINDAKGDDYNEERLRSILNSKDGIKYTPLHNAIFSR